MEIIAFPDAEALAVGYLNSVLDVPVKTQIPSPRPNSMVRVTRTGGTQRNLITDQPILVFECWGANTTEASDLGRAARAYIGALEGTEFNGVWVRKVTEVGGLAFFPDPNTDLPRYQFTVALDVRGGAL